MSHSTYLRHLRDRYATVNARANRAILQKVPTAAMITRVIHPGVNTPHVTTEPHNFSESRRLITPVEFAEALEERWQHSSLADRVPGWPLPFLRSRVSPSPTVRRSSPRPVKVEFAPGGFSLNLRHPSRIPDFPPSHSVRSFDIFTIRLFGWLIQSHRPQKPAYIIAGGLLLSLSL